MEILNNIIQTTLESFDFSYCIIVNLLTYLIVNTVNDLNNKPLSTWYKRLILLGVIIFISMIYYLCDSSVKILLNSSILAPVFWSWVLKPICKKFGIDYKQIDIDKQT